MRRVRDLRHARRSPTTRLPPCRVARACLLAHHGVIACGASLDAALALAVEVENLARTYVVVRALGEPRLLGRDEMERVLERFRTYGQAPT